LGVGGGTRRRRSRNRDIGSSEDGEQEIRRSRGSGFEEVRKSKDVGESFVLSEAEEVELCRFASFRSARLFFRDEDEIRFSVAQEAEERGEIKARISSIVCLRYPRRAGSPGGRNGSPPLR